MGKTTSKKMIPLLILRILWKHADKENMVTMDFICNRLEEDFEAERRIVTDLMSCPKSAHMNCHRIA